MRQAAQLFLLEQIVRKPDLSGCAPEEIAAFLEAAQGFLQPFFGGFILLDGMRIQRRTHTETGAHCQAHQRGNPLVACLAGNFDSLLGVRLGAPQVAAKAVKAAQPPIGFHSQTRHRQAAADFNRMLKGGLRSFVCQ